VNPDMEVVRRLRDQLSDLSMRNRSLRLARLPKSRTFDLAWLDRVNAGASLKVLASLLKPPARKLRLLDVGTGDEEASALHRGLTYLDREARLVEQERGIYDLSLGFGFLCGTIADRRFVQAPLFLLPRRLKLERKSSDGASWNLTPLGDEEGLEVNRTLLLALQRHADVTLDPEALEARANEVLSEETFGEAWLMRLTKALGGLLTGRNLKVAPTASPWRQDAAPATDWTRVPPLPVYRTDELPTPPPLQFELRLHAVLSRFPMADTALVDDYDRLMSSLTANPSTPVLRGYARDLVRGGVTTQPEPPTETSPRFHIEPTDASQEAVIARVVSGTSLAVHGPPGTGKSQLIANLVATSTALGARVLVVSQKRAALDVVHERLGSELQRFVALVHDPVRDRPLFCEQVLKVSSGVLDGNRSVRRGQRDGVLAELAALERWFGSLHDAMTTTGSGGLSATEVYAARLLHKTPVTPQLMALLPDLPREVVRRHLPEADRYVRARRTARPKGTWHEQRPSWAERTLDDLDRFFRTDLKTLEVAIDAARQWRETWDALRVRHTLTGHASGLGQSAAGSPPRVRVATPPWGASTRFAWAPGDEPQAPEGTTEAEEAAGDAEAWQALGGFLEALAALPASADLLLRGVLEGLSGLGNAGHEPELPATHWTPDAPDELPRITAAASWHDDYAALAEAAQAALRLGGKAWPVMRALIDAAERSPSSRVARELALLEDLLVARKAASGETADPAAAGAVEACISAFEEASSWFLRSLRPQWHVRKKALRAALGTPKLPVRAVPDAVSAWRAAVRHARALEAARPLLLAKAALDGRLESLTEASLAHLVEDALQAAEVLTLMRDLHLRVAPPRDLEEARVLRARALLGCEARKHLRELEARALAVRAAWRKLPDRARSLIHGRVPERSALGALGAARTHMRAAVGIARSLGEARDALAGWVGPAGRTWVDDAIKAGGAAALCRRLEVEVGTHFAAAIPADAICDAFETEAPLVARMALSVDALEPGGAVTTLVGAALAEREVREVERMRPLLKTATREEIRDRRARLRELWEVLRIENGRTVAALLEERALGARTSLAALRQRAEQRRFRWSLRKMVEAFWDGPLSKLLPIWLCSPEAVAAALPLREDLFDLVIFDEASQLTLARGLTSTLRARTCVVAGDDRQLPPSSFFTATLDEEEDESLEAAEEALEEESLLARAKVAGPETALMWHYRSRFPELIQFSNERFYHGSLRVAPVPWAVTSPPAIGWLPVDGSWEQRRNEAEARQAVTLLAELLEDHPTLTVGVITLNRQQSDRIEDLVAERAARDPAFATAWDKALARDVDSRPFVRNLENVQGDERDIIVLSIGFSPDASGRVPLRFGPLSVTGGERRLNVAVSRARMKMVVLCSFEPETALDVSKSTSEGAKLLKDFLVFARERGHRAESASGAAWFGHEAHETCIDDVAQVLAAAGWETERSVGRSQARVDLAVRSRREPDRFILGLLLDGPGAVWGASTIGRELGRIAYLERYHWRVEVLPIRAWVQSGPEVATWLLETLEAAEAAGAVPERPPALRPSIPAHLASSPRLAAASSTGSRGTTSSPRATAPPKTAPTPTPSYPVQRPTQPLTARPGGTVRYRRIDGGLEREVVLTGPMVPRGVQAIALDTPLARALLDAAVGDVVELVLDGRPLELEILSVAPPDAWSKPDGTGG
jgi:hypothetical protein